MQIRPTLSFSDENKIGTYQAHDDALVVTLQIGGYDVRRVLVDQGCGAEIVYPDLYKGLKLKLEHLVSYDSPLVGFNGKTIIPKGMIKLPIQAGSRVVEVNFILVKAYSLYTAILARPWLHAIKAMSSTLHLKVKFSFKDHVKPWQGNAWLLLLNTSPRMDPWDFLKSPCSNWSPIDTDLERYFQIGVQLPFQEKEEFLAFLRRNIDVFDWSAYKAPRVDLNFICHHLNVNPTIIPKKQPPRRSSKEHVEAVKEEVMKLKCVGAIEEVFYPECLANTVVVKKKSGK
ncbi:uncharacterized protein LOC142616232 [Castanea sativa]|uniref:uncharacterized protein LOC142616232 n=1 Tax=Castanea sativa TaxID=21020 RepID=UPI003F654534